MILGVAGEAVAKEQLAWEKQYMVVGTKRVVERVVANRAKGGMGHPPCRLAFANRQHVYDVLDNLTIISAQQ